MHSRKGNNRDFTFSRSIVDGALTAYIKNSLSTKNPVHCLDLSKDREEYFKWIKTHGTSINVVGVETCPNGVDHHEGSQKSESNYVVIEKTDFNFIYVECTTEGSSYFDSVFRKIARNGLFALSTSDDPALYGRPAEPALRCYGGFIARTFYAPELAIRLIFAAMARSAARFSKSIEVMLAVTIKSSITILVRVKKGAESAVKCLKEIKTLIHCSVCEERAFLNDNDGYVMDGLQQYLSCDCATRSVGRTIMALGPLWAGSIGSSSFVTSLLPYVTHSLYLSKFLEELIIELGGNSPATKQQYHIQKLSVENNSMELSNVKTIPCDSLQLADNPLKRKSTSDKCELEKKLRRSEKTDPIVKQAPTFYYNLHKHKPKGTQKLLKVDKIIEVLHCLGFKASRTHFDRAAIKTNCTLSELQSVISQVS